MPIQSFGRSNFQCATIGLRGASTNYRLNGGSTAVVSFKAASCNGGNYVQIGSALTADYNNATSSRITVNQPGYYRVSAHGSYNGAVKTKNTGFEIYRNGAALSVPCAVNMIVTDTGDSTDTNGFHLERTMWLEPGDYIQLYALLVASGDGYLTECELSVHSVG